MINKAFAHVHTHSMHSLLDGLGSPEQYASKAEEMGFTHIAVTDHGNVDGCIKWQKACLKHNLKPVLGCEGYLISDASHKKTATGHITFLAKNEEGWYTLCRLLTRANTEGFYYKPRIAAPWLYEEDLSGLVILTGCMQTFLMLDVGMDLLEYLQGETDVYLEIMPHDIPGMDNHAEIIRTAMKRFPELPLIVSNDCHYTEPEDAETQNVLLAVQRKAKWSDPERFKFDFDGLHLRSADEMAEAFRKQGLWSKKEWLTGMRNALKVAKMCGDFRIPEHEPTLPVVRGTEGRDPAHLLYVLATETEAAKDILQDETYRERLEEEMDLITRKGFAPYFLLIIDILTFCDKEGIMVGPGRGSVGGSLVAYLTGITQVDPLKYDLLFNRFLEEDREDYPDIDLDFEDHRRGEIRTYLEETYGKECVVGVSTYFKMKGKYALRDVARVFEADSLLTDQFSKAITYEGKGSKMEEWVVESSANDLPEGQKFKRKYPEVVRHAARLENMVRGAGRHPAAIVVAGESLYTGSRCAVAKRQDEMVTNWDMDDLEHTGLIKLDVLGLNTLSVLNEARQFIEETTGDKIVWEKISLDDKKVYEELRNGNTAGVFQLSAGPTTNLAKEMEISSFEEIVACIALVRPGPFDAGMTADYVRRSKGKKWEPKHPIYEEICKETYGIVAYQEQIMRIVSEMAGLSRNYANKVRKVIGKKRDPKEFQPYWEAFRDGCKKQKTMTEREAKDFWDELQKFAAYAFNRCLTGDTLVLRGAVGRNGREISISKLYARWNAKSSVGEKYRRIGVKILQVNADGRIRPGRCVGVHYNGSQKVFRVVTESGKNIRATENHRFLTDRGYQQTQFLKGAKIVVMGEHEGYRKRGCGTDRAKGKTYRGRGFQNGKENIAYVDGRTAAFEQAKKIVSIRAGGRCEGCGEKENGGERFEFAHLRPLEGCGRNYKKYHSPSNIKRLCNSCHKKLDYEKGERRGRFSVGYPVKFEKVSSITYEGVEPVYDLEMEGPDHNFIANGIASHNSHSVSYSMIAYWTAWCKTHYPTQFICAALSRGQESQKPQLLQEAMRLGLQVMPPRVGLSDSHKWKATKDQLLAPFIEVKGIGEVAAKKCAKLKRAEGGFFEEGAPIKKGSAIDKILIEIGAYEDGLVPEEAQKYFSFRPGRNAAESYPNLAKLMKEKGVSADPKTIQSLLHPKPKDLELLKGLVKPTRAKDAQELTLELIQCGECPLRQECDRPVPFDVGLYNAGILGEAPGEDEDRLGEGLVGRSGKLLWKHLKAKGVLRRHVHVSNVCKCWPSTSKTPSKEQMEACIPWFMKEMNMSNLCLILALGNTPRWALAKEEKILQANGTIDWVEDIGAWVCWCVHPAFALRGEGDKLKVFKQGLKTFADAFKALRR